MTKIERTQFRLNESDNHRSGMDINYIWQAENIIKSKYNLAYSFHEKNGFAEYFKEKREKFKYFCIFGGGVLGTTLCKWLQKNQIFVDFFCDNNQQKLGTSIESVPFIDFKSLNSIRQDTFVMVSTTNKDGGHRYNEEINKQLNEFEHIMPNILKFMAYYVNDYKLSYKECLNGAIDILQALQDYNSKELFLDLLPLKFVDSADPIEKNPLEKYYDPLQYFTHDCYQHSEQERIVDCGAFKGDTLQSFLNLYGNKFETYHCFEMDQYAFAQLQANISQFPQEVRRKIETYPVGVYFENRTAHYSTMTNTLGSLIDDNGEEEAHLVPLDEALKNERITMIKMDIENSELEALMGAERLINENHPMLAISIYHSTEQFFRVPLYILKKFPFYKLYLRQHTTITDDTVLYAIPY